MTTNPNRTLLSLLACLTLLGAAAGQKDKKGKWKIDPYTDNKPKALAKAGILSLGPFPFGNIAKDPVDSTKIAETLDEIPLLWLETEHFRIGVQLPTWQVPTQKETRLKIRAELEELQKKLPRVKPRARRLDPWLRAHMTAHRLEKLYAETMEQFGVKQEDFPAKDQKVIVGGTYMGYGPYMGMKDKFLVLVIDKLEHYNQYMRKYVGRDTKFPQRWHFTESSSILFACALESNDFPLEHDTALHCALAFNVSQNLLDGFRYYMYDLPVWIKEGWGHWNSRRIGKWSNFDQNEGSIADMRMIDDWKVYARGLIAKEDKWEPFPTVAGWSSFGDIKFNDHVMCFARMDYLISRGKKPFKEFLFTVKGRVDENWAADARDLVGATRDALKKAYKLSFLTFDDRFKQWVKDTYPIK